MKLHYVHIFGQAVTLCPMKGSTQASRPCSGRDGAAHSSVRTEWYDHEIFRI